MVVSGPAEGWDNSPSGGQRGSAAARQLGLSVNLRSLGTRKADGHDAKSGPAGCRWQHFSRHVTEFLLQPSDHFFCSSLLLIDNRKKATVFLSEFIFLWVTETDKST